MLKGKECSGRKYGRVYYNYGRTNMSKAEKLKFFVTGRAMKPSFSEDEPRKRKESLQLQFNKLNTL